MIYTDGACSGNPGPGGWAWATSPTGEPSATGGASHTTNQRMELMAALEALRAHVDHVGPIEIRSEEERIRPKNSEVERLWADNQKAQELFGWQPTYAGREGFMRGLVETIDWLTQPNNLRAYKSDIYNV